MDQSYMMWGLRVGTLAGIRIRIHWILLVFWAFRLSEVLERKSPPWFWLISVVLSFSLILLHEFGHCFAARAVGGSADDILLWPLGGLAFCDTPNDWRSRLYVAAGGPLVTLVLTLTFATVAWMVPAFSKDSPNDYVYFTYVVLVEWQFVLLLFNLIPLYPLDGGRIFLNVTWALLLRFGRGYDTYRRAAMATVWASRVTAVIGIAVSLFWGNLFLIFIFLWAFSNAENLKRSAHYGGGVGGGGGGGFMGYDFSQGYTSLEGRPRRQRPGGSWLGRLFGRRRQASVEEEPRLHIPTPPAPAVEEQRQVDELLAKISREGIQSLTRRERKFLERVSKRWSEPKD